MSLENDHLLGHFGIRLECIIVVSARFPSYPNVVAYSNFP